MEKILSWLENFKSFFSSEVSKISNAQAELADAKTKLTTAEDTLKALNATITDREAKITTLETAAKEHAVTVAAKDAEIASLKAAVETEKNRSANTLAQQGLPPEALPEAEPSSGAKSGNPDFSNLSGLDKARAVFAAQLAKKN